MFLSDLMPGDKIKFRKKFLEIIIQKNRLYNTTLKIKELVIYRVIEIDSSKDYCDYFSIRVKSKGGEAFWFDFEKKDEQDFPLEIIELAKD